jgi:uncharacterized protein YqgC (DUF456 family)
MGALSALPIISAGNICCCLWMVCGGAVAAYVLQQNQETAVTPGDGALAGLLAGLAGAVIYLVLTIPITILMAPLQQAMMDRFLRNAGNLPPEFRDYVGTSVGTVVGVAIGFFFILVFGCIFSTLGGLLGAAIFKKQMHGPAHDAP